MAEAIKNAGAANADKIADGLLKIDGYKGVTGTITYAGGTHIPVKTVTLLEIDKGAYKLIETVTPKQVPKP